MRKSALDLAHVAQHERFEFLEAAAARWAAIEPVSGTKNFAARWRMWELDQLIVSEAYCAPTRFKRTTKTHNRYDNEFLLIQLYLSGSSDVVVGNERVRTRDGYVYLFDKSRPFSSVCNGARTAGIVVAHDAIGYDPLKHPAVIVAARSSPAARLLTQILSTLPTRLDAMTSDESGPLAREIIEALRALYFGGGRGPGAGALRRARRVAIENYIEGRLQAADLGVADICAAFGLSRRSLYRHFSDECGPGDYIRRRRLHAAFRELKSTELTRGAIRRVSDRWGFYDTSHFNRAFRDWFEVNPTQVALLPRPSEATTVAPDDLLAAWQPGLRSRVEMSRR